MLTPQDITEKSFEKVLIGGYDTVAVDEFLESLSTDYNAMYKENGILKSKLKVLVEKVEEYRSTEDAMRMALLTAQRMGEEITDEAARTKEEMLKSADEEVKAKLAENAKRIAAEEAKLAAVSKETAKFLELSQAIVRKHSEFLKKLEAANHVSKPASSTQPAAGTAASSDTAPAPKPAVASAKPAAPKAVKPKPAAPVVTPVVPAVPEPEVAPPTMPTPAPVMRANTAAAEPLEFDNIAQEIGNAIEEITSDVPTPAAKTPLAARGDVSSDTLTESANDTKELPMTDTLISEVTPRPKFDFDDLKFGANFDSDE